MTLSRSPSPVPGGGWTSPGLTTPSSSSGGGRSSSPGSRAYPNGGSAHENVTWASAKARSSEVKGYSSFSTRNQGFVRRHLRRLSLSLPYFSDTGNSQLSYAEREKLGREKHWSVNGNSKTGRVLNRIGRLMWRMRLRLGVILGILFLILMFYVTPLHRVYRRASWLGGGSKYVIILGANEGGGVMEWKGPREWAIERDSVKNKKNYARRWGYELEIVDMSTKKRYAHEWRESWEKVDTIRNTMRKYPRAEWFWWLDLNTFIMEPSIPLHKHIFKHLDTNTYRDINVYNPRNFTHPPTEAYLDTETRSAVGDGKPSSISLMLTQDCGGFNLGSFFMRRGAWADRLMDIWWDPVGYEQKHMQWEHKEQDALESMYRNQPVLRSHVAFLPQRKVNSFPPAACAVKPKKEKEEGENGKTEKDEGDPDEEELELDPRFHYNEQERDFLVNMAGCEWGRDCWGEMYHYRQLSNWLNRTPWEKFKDGISDSFKAMFGGS